MTIEGNIDLERARGARQAAVTVTTSAGVLLAAADDRTSFLIVNNSGNEILVSFAGAGLTSTAWIAVPDGGTFGQVGYTGAVHAKAGSSSVVQVVEFG